ncbi:thioesterase II family protein [Streptomyces sp. NPDC058000]|uniref:thioesterase II family protein n=1 Tax=Streptomyces sp. NPDC058000 TaxID=3346299 RepID=UPI0036E39EF7
MALSSALSSGTPWLRTHRPVAAPRIRLICFPHAGGTASFFRNWHQWAPEDWEMSAVRYPGREERIAEPCHDSMAELAGRLADALVPVMDVPTVFFGHSMGASVAHEVTALLAARGARTPRALFVSGRAAPDRLRRTGAGELADDELLARVAGLGGPGAELLQDPELRDLVLPPIRADYQLLEAYAAGPKAPAVDVPVTAYFATDDPGPSPDDVRAWSNLTTAGCETRAFSGGHFFLVPHERDVVRDMSDRLAALL